MPRVSISFVIPMYNELGGIARTVKELTKIGAELSDDYEIIISDDASSDGSNFIVENLAKADARVKLERLSKNTKFGGALRAGISRARKEIIVYTDSDLPVSREDIKGALSLLDGCDIVTAVSAVKKGENLKRVIISRVYNFLIQFLFKTNIKDINSGFKIYRRKIFDGMELISESPFIDVEIFVRALRKKCVIKEYTLIFKKRGFGISYISRPAVVFKTLTDMLRFKWQKD